ncbi:HAD family hydrolase [Candidatus Agathobaculum pullicola]|uniref:HAD family hydrolase n=1 Tax=Candidatus Agathobaculum pullicola TaxID=2838426 RepID=UPI003F9163DC
MHEFKGAIFDMDGTLLDSMPVWKRLTQGYLAEFGLTITDEEYAVCEGFSQPQVAQYFANRYPELPGGAPGLMEGMDRLITTRYETIAKPKDGVIEFLDGLRRRGVKMAIATLTARRHAEKALRDRNMMGYFEFMLTIEDVGISKYQPDIYLKSAEKMGLAPADCIVFEDAPYACATAKRAGFRVCGMVEPAYAAGENELRSVSDFVVEQSYDELCGKL